ncbi:hypothetical protein S101258_00343 [Lactiplantibacillus plantarum subsp. plantarum]|uniref:Uncharacterized protein n=1 Tax=Lactiplantibacillus plantarum subsp. plantarum TaxID=337330 RepID=A0A2S3UA28_LACPN|nr:hypothetical protein S101258_00343 [Lactiplantibacillus plantarum subsp. plantarum]
MATIKRIGFPYQLLIALVLAVIFGNFFYRSQILFYNLLGTVYSLMQLR